LLISSSDIFDFVDYPREKEALLKYINMISKAQKRLSKENLDVDWESGPGKTESKYQKELIQIEIERIKVLFIFGNYQKTIK
jgi:hypothetical protein